MYRRRAPFRAACPQLFDALDLSSAALQPVRDAVARGDYSGAEHAWAEYLRHRSDVPWIFYLHHPDGTVESHDYRHPVRNPAYKNQVADDAVNGKVFVIQVPFTWPDNNINWFFSQYVYGSEVGSYHLNYKLNPEPDGKVLFTGTVTQSGVGGQFRMRVPIYLDFGQGPPVKLADVAVAGNGTSSELKIRLPKRPKKVLLNYNYDVLAQDTSVSEM